MKTQICDRCSRSIEDGALYEDHSEGASFVTPTAAKRKRLGINAPWEKDNPTRPPEQRLPSNWHDCDVAEKQILDLTLELRQVTAQRDELLAALKTLLEYPCQTVIGGSWPKDVSNARTVVAKCEAQP